MLAVSPESTIVGGAERSFLMVLCGLRDRFGAEIDVLVPRRHGSLNDRLTERGFSWSSATYFSHDTSLHGDLLDPARLGKAWGKWAVETVWSRRFVPVARSRGYDLVYTNTHRPMIGAMLADQLGVPHVAHIRDIYTDGGSGLPWGGRQLHKASSGIIFVSNASRHGFAGAAADDKSVTVYNGVESPIAEAPRLVPSMGSLDVLMTGRVVPRKGHRDAVEAVHRLQQVGVCDIRLHIAGAPPKGRKGWRYWSELRQRASTLGLNGTVVFHGDVADIDALRLSMDCELMCAENEAFGKVTVEAMRRGLVVIGAATGGTTELVADGVTGLLYRHGSVEDLADTIRWVYDHRAEARAIAERALRESANRFLPETNVAEVYAVLRGVLDSRD